MEFTRGLLNRSRAEWRIHPRETTGREIGPGQCSFYRTGLQHGIVNMGDMIEGPETYRPSTLRGVELELLLVRFQPPQTHRFKLALLQVR
jgi:hypothetical protein